MCTYFRRRRLSWLYRRLSWYHILVWRWLFWEIRPWWCRQSRGWRLCRATSCTMIWLRSAPSHHGPSGNRPGCRPHPPESSALGSRSCQCAQSPGERERNRHLLHQCLLPLIHGNQNDLFFNSLNRILRALCRNRCTTFTVRFFKPVHQELQNEYSYMPYPVYYTKSSLFA